MKLAVVISFFLTLSALCALSAADCSNPNSCVAPCKWYAEDNPPAKDALPSCNNGLSQHCSAISKWLWKTCKANGWGPDMRVATEYPEIDSCCWCTCVCSCFQRGTGVKGYANDTEGFFAIENFAQGDSVTVLDTDPRASPLVWKDRKIVYSAGTKVGAVNSVIIVIYGTDAGAKSLVSTPEQLYLASEHVTGNQLVLVRADHLNPSVHKLIDFNGKEVPITVVQEGTSSQGVWHVSTDDDDTRARTHLLNVEGIIAADFFLSTQNASDYKWDIPVSTKHARVNSLAHSKQNPTLKSTPQADLRGVTLFDPTAASGFEPPKNAKSFIPTWMGLVQSEMVPLNTSSRTFVRYLLALYGALQPQINFVFYDSSPIVNAFTYRTRNAITIEIHGGLVRQTMMGWEGIALIIARQIASVEGGEPYYNNNTREYSCENTADHMLYTFLRGVFMNPSGPVQFIGVASRPGLAQIEAFFTSLPSKGPVTGAECAHPQDAINVACRMAIIRAGGNFAPMPDCWNKPGSTPTGDAKTKKEPKNKKAAKNKKDEL